MVSVHRSRVAGVAILGEAHDGRVVTCGVTLIVVDVANP
jgi:hypothetical protein